MKPQLMFSIFVVTAIVIASSFGYRIVNTPPLQLPDGMADIALYVCPAASSTWDSIAATIHPFRQYATMIFFATVMILMFMWGWNLYQNLLNDKFNRSSFSSVWKLTKTAFWGVVILTLLSATPNHYRTVHVAGSDQNWVLCDSNSVGARAVRANAVSL